MDEIYFYYLRFWSNGAHIFTSEEDATDLPARATLDEAILSLTSSPACVHHGPPEQMRFRDLICLLMEFVEPTSESLSAT